MAKKTLNIAQEGLNYDLSWKVWVLLSMENKFVNWFTGILILAPKNTCWRHSWKVDVISINRCPKRQKKWSMTNSGVSLSKILQFDGSLPRFLPFSWLVRLILFSYLSLCLGPPSCLAFFDCSGSRMYDLKALWVNSPAPLRIARAWNCQKFTFFGFYR